MSDEFQQEVSWLAQQIGLDVTCWFEVTALANRVVVMQVHDNYNVILKIVMDKLFTQQLAQTGLVCVINCRRVVFIPKTCLEDVPE